MREGQQGNGEHDAYHAEACHDSQGDEHHQGIFEKSDGKLLRTCEFRVESDGDDRAQEQGKKQGEHQAEYAEQKDIAPGDGQDVPE